MVSHAFDALCTVLGTYRYTYLCYEYERALALYEQYGMDGGRSDEGLKSKGYQPRTICDDSQLVTDSVSTASRLVLAGEPNVRCALSLKRLWDTALLVFRVKISKLCSTIKYIHI